MIRRSEQTEVPDFESRLAEIAHKYESGLGSSIAHGKLTRRTLRTLAIQVYLQEKWPSHIAQVYLGLDEEALADPQVVDYIISIIKAENLGVGSSGLTHTELARKFANFLGVSDSILRSSVPLATNQVLMDWCDASSLDRHWLDALAVHLACEAQHAMMRSIRKGLVKNYGAGYEDVRFWTIHAGPLERRHAREATAILVKYLTKDRESSIIYIYEVTCRLVRDFYDSIL